MLGIDLSQKRVLVAGVADDGGFGFAIAKAMAQAGASICVGTWPPAYNIFMGLLERNKLDESRTLADGRKFEFERIYALDADFDVYDDMPEEVRTHRRYVDRGDCSIQGVADQMVADFGPRPVDIVVHSLANGPEVKNPLLETSRRGYLAAVGASAYSYASMIQRFGPIMRDRGSFLALTYMASERAVPGYGGGMSAAKAALEADTRLLALEAGRKWGHRVNVISAGPYASRAASAIGFIHDMINFTSANTPIQEPMRSEEIGAAAAFVCSDLGSGINATTLYVDKGFHAMGLPSNTIQPVSDPDQA